MSKKKSDYKVSPLGLAIIFTSIPPYINPKNKKEFLKNNLDKGLFGSYRKAIGLPESNKKLFWRKKVPNL